jgi:hypothetical protein
MRLARLWFAVALLAVAACTDETNIEPVATSSEGGGGTAACAAGRNLDDGSCAPPGVPADGCAEGFVHDDNGGCDAIVPDEACPSGEMALPGDASCREVAPCGSERWPVAGGSAALYVDGSYTAGDGDGSMLKPFPTIAEAMAAASDGGEVLVTDGAYAETAVIDRVSLRGRCPALVHIEPPMGAGIVAQLASDVTISGVSVTASDRGIQVEASSNVALSDIWVHDTTRQGIFVFNATVTIDNVLVEGAHRRGVIVWGGSSATLNGIEVRGTKQENGDFGHGLTVIGDDGSYPLSNVELRKSRLENNHIANIVAIGSTMTVDSSLVRGGIVNPATGQHHMVESLVGETGVRGSLQVSRSVIEGGPHLGITGFGVDMAVSDTVVRDVGAVGGSSTPRSILAQILNGHRTTVTVERVLVERAYGAAVSLYSSDGKVERAWLRDTLADPASGIGRGVSMTTDENFANPSTLQLAHTIVDGGFGEGVVGLGGDLVIDDVAVLNIAPESTTGLVGDGIASAYFADAPATLSVTRSHIFGSARAGLVWLGVDLQLADSVLDCNAIQLNLENTAWSDGALHNGGGNVCRCGEVEEDCRVVSSGLKPPRNL